MADDDAFFGVVAEAFVSPESSSVEVGYAGETNSSSAPARMFAKAAR